MNLFNNLLDVILTDKTLECKNQEDKNTNENEKVENRKEENEKVESKKEENEDEDENEDDDKTRSQNEKNKIKVLNDNLDEIINKSKSFEEQIKSLKKLEGLKGYWPYNDFGDKELKFKYFKIELADMSNKIDEKLFKQILGHTIETLANKLINTKNKEENQIIVNNIYENKEKLYEEKLYEEDEMSAFYDYVIQPSDWCNNLIEAINVILDFNETILLDLVWEYKNQIIKKWASNFNWWKQSKLLSTLCHQKNCFFFCMYKMYLISAEGYENANVDFLTIKITSEIWVSMKDVGSGMGVKTYLI